MFFKPRHRLTKLCERASWRAIENAAMDDTGLFRAEFDRGSKRAFTSESDRRWSAWMRDAEHPKRSTIVYMITSLAAAELWKAANEMALNPDMGLSSNPFKRTNSDVIVAEALMFFWYNIFLFVREAVNTGKFTQADKQAVADAGNTMCHVIQETTQWPIKEILDARLDQYEDCDASRNPIEAFCGVLLCSIGKQSINDPDRSNSLAPFCTPVAMQTMIHMTAMLPAYFDTYKNIVEHYPMD